MNVLMCDLGFSSAKWIYEERRVRIISAFSYNVTIFWWGKMP